MEAADAGGEEKQQAVSSTFERLHGELVREAGELAASCGADVTVLAVSPRSGAPRVSRFGGGGGGIAELFELEVPRSEEVASMVPDAVVALDERLRSLRLLALRRIKEEEEKEKAKVAAADRPPAKP